MLEGGFIKLHRKMTKWGWYHDANTFRLFVHLLLTANYEPRPFEGRTIERGQRAASIAGLSNETDISVQSIRTAMNHLKSTGEITTEPMPKYTIITIKNYDSYQRVTSDQTNDQQTTDKRSTNDQQQWKKDKESKRKIKKDKNEGDAHTRAVFGEFRNVLLSETELSELRTRYPRFYEAKIERLSRYLASTGKTYRNHFATLLDWLQEDTAKEEPVQESSYDINELDKIDTLDFID